MKLNVFSNLNINFIAHIGEKLELARVPLNWWSVLDLEIFGTPK